MSLSNNPLPAHIPTRSLPIDVNMLFTQNWSYAASGLLSAAGPGGAPFQADVGPGRFDGLWVVDLQTLKVSAGNEVYQLALLASNDPAFGAGNVELLAIHDWAAAANGRFVPSFCGASPVVPPGPNAASGVGPFVRRHVFPFSNELGGYVLRYLQAYLALGGTAPSIKLSSWITYDTAR